MIFQKIFFLILQDIAKKKRLYKYRKYNIASSGDAMHQYVDWIKNFTTLSVKNVFEIGANFAQDAEVLMKDFGLTNQDIYVFEAHPQIYEVICSLHNFHTYNVAVYNECKNMTFNICDINNNNTGISSLRIREGHNLSQKVCVKAIRMDDFMRENSITNIDFLKLDVEGCNWEVLDGFGEMLKHISAIQIESEHKEKWNGEKLWEDIKDILVKNNFELVYFERKYSQSDSLWVQKQFLKDD